MTRSGHRFTRSHLSLTCALPGPPLASSRAALWWRAVLARVRVLLLNVPAAAGTLVALAPLLLRRRPLGHRAQVPRAAARVVALQPYRRASPP